MIKAVLFDLDGTICNSLGDLAASVNFTLEKLGFKTHEVEAFKYFAGNGIPKMIERALPEGHKTQEDVKKALEIFMPYYKDHSSDLTQKYDGIAELLSELKKRNIKIAVCTNKAEPLAKEVVKSFYGDIFDLVFGQREGIPAKPDPTLAKLLMKELKVEAQECIFMGDSGVDVQTAVNSGAVAVGVLWGFREITELNENGAEFVIEKPSDLLNLIDALNS